MDHQSSPQDLPPKIFINGDEFIGTEFVDDDDILRGDRHSICQTPELASTHSIPPSAEQGSAASLRSFSTMSSGSFRLAGGRLGTLATRLEHAITRWAHKNWADSSSSLASSASSETRSSFRTSNKSKKSSRRRRRPPSLANIQQREQSERAVAARIRAREIGRIVPREFNLYSPPPPSVSQDADLVKHEQRVIRTFSLDVMLPHLEHIRRKPAKPRRTRHRAHAPRTEHDQPHLLRHLHPPQGPSAEVEARSASHSDALEDPLRKGKGKITLTAPPPNPPQITSTSRRNPVEVKPPQAWWLDVASPSWEDMRTLGKASSSPFLLLTVRLTRGTAVAPSPTDPGGYPTAGTARET